MKYYTLRKFDTKRAGGRRFQYSIYNDKGELIDISKQSGRDYVAALVTPRSIFWFGRFNLVGKGDSKKRGTDLFDRNELALAVIETVNDHIGTRRELIRTGGRNQAGRPIWFYELPKNLGFGPGRDPEPVKIDFEPVVYTSPVDDPFVSK